MEVMETLPIELIVVTFVAVVGALIFWRKAELAKQAKQARIDAYNRKREIRRQRILSEIWDRADRANAPMRCRRTPREIYLSVMGGSEAQVVVVDNKRRFKLS